MLSSKLLPVNERTPHLMSKANKVIKTERGYSHTFALKLLVVITVGILPVLAFAANTSPKVNAGKDKVVVYPSSTSTTLSGSGSDAEGSVTFKWTQVRGVTTATISTSTSASTAVGNLNPGLYTFKLTVTDNSGATKTD